MARTSSKKHGLFWWLFISWWIWIYYLARGIIRGIKKITGMSRRAPVAAPRTEDRSAYSFAAVGLNYRLKNLMAVAEPSRAFRYPDEKLIEKYSDGRRIYQYFFSGLQGTLVPEPTNPHDRNAIKVELAGSHIAYVPAELCVDVAKLLRQGYTPQVNVRGGPYKVVDGETVYTVDGPFSVWVDFY